MRHLASMFLAFNLSILFLVNALGQCPTNIDLYVNDECEAILPDYTEFVSDSLVGSVVQLPPAGTVIEAPSCKVQLISEVSTSDTIVCEFWVAKLDTTTIHVSPLFSDTLYLNDLGRITVPDLRDSFLVNANCELRRVTQDLTPGSVLGYRDYVDIRFNLFFKFRSISQIYTFHVVDTLDLLHCPDTELHLDEEGVVSIQPELFSNDAIDFLELQTPEGFSVINLDSDQLKFPFDLQLCDRVGDTLHLQMQDSAGRSCESRIKIKVGSFFSQSGRVFDQWCTSSAKSALYHIMKYPVVVEMPCGFIVELPYIADWSYTPDCRGDTLQMIYREFELRKFVDQAIYFDTIVVFNSVPFSTQNFYCPATVTLSRTELDNISSKSPGPMYVYSESATDHLLDIDNDGDHRDTLFFIEYVDTDSSQTINNIEEIVLSNGVSRLSKDCGIKATLHSEKVDGIPCHNEFNVTLDLIQECTGRDAETSFQNVDMEDNSIQKINENHWRATYILRDTSKIDRPISCYLVTVGDQTFTDLNGQVMKSSPSGEVWSPGRDRFPNNTSGNEMHNYYHLKCYPNPTRGHAVMEFQLIDRETLTFTVFDSMGQVISSYSDRFEKGLHLLDLGKDLGASSGVYCLKLEGSHFYTVQRIIKM